VPGKTPQPAGRVAVECPHCGFKQLESPFAKSTFCRKCSEHYELGKPKAEPKPSEGRTSLLARFGGLFARNTTRDITCFHCGAVQTVSNSATSSLCPHCSTYIDLSDFKIAAAFSRSVETQGKVRILPKGDVTSARIACSEAYIQGKLRGNLFSTGEVRVKLKGKLPGGLDVNRLVIERRSEVEAVRAIKARSVEVAGKLSARLHVDGTVTIAKKGWLEGTVYAKGINVEKGGVFLGELIIGRQELSQPELLPMEPPERDASAAGRDASAAGPGSGSSPGSGRGPGSAAADAEPGDLKFGVG